MLVGSLIGVVAVAATVVFLVNRPKVRPVPTPVPAPPVVQRDRHRSDGTARRRDAGDDAHPTGRGGLTVAKPDTTTTAAKPTKPPLDTAAVMQLVGRSTAATSRRSRPSSRA